MTPVLAPLVVGVVVGVAAWQWQIFPTFSNAEAAVAFGGTVASISSTMLGFVLAALAILASISETHLVRMMRESGHYMDLLKTMLMAMAVFLVCAVIGIALLFTVPASPPLLAAAVGVHASALVSMVDMGRKLWMVLRSLSERG